MPKKCVVKRINKGCYDKTKTKSYTAQYNITWIEHQILNLRQWIELVQKYTHYYWIFPQNGYNGNDILGYFDIKKIIVLVPWIMIFVKDTSFIYMHAGPKT
jgi:hypothetical protein